jgi:hypothetical protein
MRAYTTYKTLEHKRVRYGQKLQTVFIYKKGHEIENLIEYANFLKRALL